MFGIGWAELLVIGVVALVVVGPEKLPEAARAAGKVYGYVYRALTEARESVKAEMDLAEQEARKDREAAKPGNGPDGDGPEAPSGGNSA